MYPAPSVNQRLPSGPLVSSIGSVPVAVVGTSVITPPVVMRPRFPPNGSVNHKAPSGPVTIDTEYAFAVGIGYSVITPAVVMRPIALVSLSVYHSAPSGPAVIPVGPDGLVGVEYCVSVGSCMGAKRAAAPGRWSRSHLRCGRLARSFAHSTCQGSWWWWWRWSGVLAEARAGAQHATVASRAVDTRIIVRGPG